MKPLRLSIRGIGPYREQADVDFTRLKSPVAIVAGYGSGKTFLTESILYALYGRGGWYTGSIYDAMTQGGDGMAMLTLDFEHGTQEYRIQRTVVANHSAWLSSNGAPLAGPKVGDVAQWVEAHIGTWETAASTWYLSQARTNDLCGQPGDRDLMARRRAAFNELLGAKGLDLLAEKMRAERQLASARIKDLEAQLAGEEDAEATVERLLRILDDVRQKTESAEATATLADASLEAVHRRSGELADAFASVNKELSEAQAKIDSVEALQRQLFKINEQIEILTARTQGLSDAAADVALLKNAQAERGRLLPLLDGYTTWERALRDHERDIGRRQGIKGELRVLAASMPSQDVIAMASREAEILSECEAVIALNKGIEAKNRIGESSRIRLWADMDNLKAQRRRLVDRLSNRPITPFGDNCAPCPLMKEWRDLPTQLAGIDNQIGLTEKDPFFLSEPQEFHDEQPLRDALSQAQEASRAVAKGEQTALRIKVLQQQDIELCPHPGQEPRDPRSALEQIQERIETLSRAPARLEAYERAVTDLARTRDQLAETHQQLSSAGALPDLQSLRERIQGRVHEVAQARQRHEDQLQRAVDLSEGLRREAQALRVEVARDEALLESAQRAAEVRAQRRMQVRTLTTEKTALDDLVECFGPRGVRQILIDAATPELEAIADDLFETATQGRMRLRIATQRLLKDGSIAEDFSIMVKDSAGERDVVAHSGGELQLCAILFRIAVSMWAGRLRGRRPDCLFLDEAFDRLGEQGAEDLLRALDSMSDRFGLICVVTHNQMIADRMGSQIRVVRRGGGAAIA